MWARAWITSFILDGPWWRSIPNAISAARLVSILILLAAAYTHQDILFRWLLLGSLLSDILDGWLARRFQLQSEVGAKLDSTADLALQGATLIGIWTFQRAFVAEFGVKLLVVAGAYVAEMLLALWRYGRISSFHTLASRIAAYAQGIFVVWLFFWGFVPALFYLLVVTSLLASFEEMALLYLLPEWTANVGGLYRVLRREPQGRRG